MIFLKNRKIKIQSNSTLMLKLWPDQLLVIFMHLFICLRYKHSICHVLNPLLHHWITPFHFGAAHCGRSSTSLRSLESEHLVQVFISTVISAGCTCDICETCWLSFPAQLHNSLDTFHESWCITTSANLGKLFLFLLRLLQLVLILDWEGWRDWVHRSCVFSSSGRYELSWARCLS